MAWLPIVNRCMNGNVGQTKVNVGKLVFTWTIENFSVWCNRTSEARGLLISLIFSSTIDGKSKLCIRLKIVNEKNLSLFLHCVTTPLKAKFNFSILNVKREEETVRRQERVYYFSKQKHSSWGYNNVMSMDTLLSKAKVLLPEDKLLFLVGLYALESLKPMYEKSLCAKLSLKTAAEILMLADLHNADQLKAKKIAFIKDHVTGVMQTEVWQSMITTHSQLVAEVLRAFAKQ